MTIGIGHDEGVAEVQFHRRLQHAHALLCPFAIDAINISSFFEPVADFHGAAFRRHRRLRRVAGPQTKLHAIGQDEQCECR
ncbi:hypothetical protein D3C80_1698930 [compost metagenome]